MHWPYKKITFFLLLILLFSLVGCSSAAGGKQADSKGKVQKIADKKASDQTASEQATEVKTSTSATATPDKSEQTTKQTNSTEEPKHGEQPAQTMPPAPSAHSGATKAPAAKATTSGASQATPTVKQPATAAVKPAAPPPAPAPAPAKTVTFSIVGPKEDHSADRAPSPVKIKDGDTILDVLLTAVGKTNVDYSGYGASAYVSGIKNIYEFDYGAKSGWTFKLNGTSIPKSAGVISVKNGDRVEAIYVE
ncbi:DUF4430 domain-containing protein [Neobacillus sp. SM06]|uniref:DUF4430 domain-containing protein n=1 Tax=Neobacillus sp. SM06 TaxID=3422492 RepID=UPI003D2AA7BC